jgi:hypothetical protein
MDCDPDAGILSGRSGTNNKPKRLRNIHQPPDAVVTIPFRSV